MEKKLERNTENRMIAGVASGLAEYLNMDISLVRLLFVLAFIFGLSGLLIYLIMWVAVPAKAYVLNPESFEADYRVDTDRSVSSSSSAYTASGSQNSKNSFGRNVTGALLMIVGLYFLLVEFDFIPHWFSFHKLWPIILIILGLLMIVRSRRNPVDKISKPVFAEKGQTETDDIEAKS